VTATAAEPSALQIDPSSDLARMSRLELRTSAKFVREDLGVGEVRTRNISNMKPTKMRDGSAVAHKDIRTRRNEVMT
jgi:hypothetical protein